MHALILTAPNCLEWRQVPEPVPAPGDVLIRVGACGICGSDVHGIDGSTGRRRPPIVMGHEAAGTIAALGPEVGGWSVGERVTFDSTVYCGHCDYCRSGCVNLCNDRRVLGVSCDEYRRDGAFAEYVAVPQRILYRLPGDLSFEHAAVVEPVSIAVHAVHRADVASDATTLVVGTGMIGLLVIQVLRARGVATIVAADIDPSRRQLARQCGADIVLDPDDIDIPTAVRDVTDGQGVDAAFEAVGIAVSVSAAVQSARKGAAVVLIGNLAPEVSVPLQYIVTRELTLLGSCASAGEYPECLDMMASGDVNVAPLLSATAPMREGAAWFDRLYRREPGLMKVILAP